MNNYFRAGICLSFGFLTIALIIMEHPMLDALLGINTGLLIINGFEWILAR